MLFICKGKRDMVRAKLKTPEGRKFLLALLVVFMIAAAGVGRATIVGVIEQYNIPLSEWTTSMYVLQSAMICVYSLVFTVLLAIPLGIFFLGDREKH
jgi:ABC-type spermidine/putrescine transport system permease subunit I